MSTEKILKHEWRKHEKDMYIPKNTPTIINVPPQKFITINGEGNPNNEDFQSRITALYPIAYTIKMLPRKGFIIDNFIDYTVYPLEGIWSLSDKAIKENIFNKDELVYTIMLRQPDFITEEIFNIALEIAKKKNNNPLFDEVKFETITDGLCAQILHIGPYDTEPESFKQLEQFLEDNNYQRTTLIHREIYLSDFRKTAPDKLKTVLRCFIESK